jgi:hypothetical protein
VQNECVCADYCAVADFYWPDDCGAGAYENVIADNGNLRKAASAPNRHMVRDLAVISNDRAAVNDDTHSIVVKGSVAANDSRVRDGRGKDKPHEVIEQLGKNGNVPAVECPATPVQCEHLAHDLRRQQDMCQGIGHGLSGLRGGLIRGRLPKLPKFNIGICVLNLGNRPRIKPSYQPVAGRVAGWNAYSLLPGHVDTSAVLIV